MARVYQSTINCTKERTGRDMGVRCRAAMTMPTRKVMARKRTRPSHESHSLTLGVDFISEFSPRYERAPLCVASPIPCRAAKAAQRNIYKFRYTVQAPREGGAWMRKRRAPHGF